jgi:NAD(P)-dependent dehydrogenase (short-subunit alcohol dehydrogenase family)/acyl dehydratase
VTKRGSAADLGYDEVDIGAVFSVERTFTAEDVRRFSQVSGDFSPLHVDVEYAEQTEFGGCVVHGMLLGALFSQLVGMHVPGRRALYLGQDLTFRRPVLIGETVRATAKVAAKNDATHVVVLQTEIRGADERVVVSGTARVKVRDSGGVKDVSESDAAPRRERPSSASPASVALVTGASRGVGAETARVLASKGWAVAINYWRSKAMADAVVEEIIRGGGRSISVQADVRDDSAVDALVATVAERLGAPALLVNSATAELESVAASDVAWEAFERHLAYQAKAVLRLCQAVRRGMVAAGGGAIVNIVSQVTNDSPPVRMADYVTAKYALLGLSKALANEWAEDNIRVNMVSPSLIRTDLTQGHHERVFKLEAARTPLRRLATTRDAAMAVAWLASEEASFLTGVNLFITGGQAMP